MNITRIIARLKAECPVAVNAYVVETLKVIFKEEAKKS